MSNLVAETHMKKQSNNTENKSEKDISFLTEEDRLRKDVYRSDLEKLHLFTQMLRLNKLFNKAQVTHKS